MFSKLDVVNSCLATLGELPLTDLMDEHPMAVAAQINLKESLVTEMHRQWWFNTDFVTLPPTDEGYIYAPEDAVAVKVDGRPELILRGRRLYNRYKSTYEMQGSVCAIVVRNIPFEDLPAPAQVLVKDACVLQFQINYDADTVKTAQLQEKYLNSYRLLNAEHSRQIQANGLETPFVAISRHNAGVLPRRGRLRGSIPVR